MKSLPELTIGSAWLETLELPAAVVAADGAVEWVNEAWKNGHLKPDELDSVKADNWQYSRSKPDEQGRCLLLAIDQSGWHQTKRDRDKLMQLASLHDLIPTLLHELKNPLASIQAMVEVMIEDSEDDDLRRSLHEILINLRRLKLGFEGLGSFGRGLRSSRAQAVDFAVKETCHVLKASFDDRGVALHYEIGPAPLLPIDSGAIRAIMYNLLSNALKACQSGDQVSVMLKHNASGSLLTIVVQDSGCGMPPADLERCTDLFFTTRSNGSGIGLALCKRAIDEFGGKLEIASEVGKGTRVLIQLPSCERSKQ